VTRRGRRTPAVATGQAVAHQRTSASSRDQSGILLQPGPDAFTGAEADCDAELASALDAAIATGLLNQHVLHPRHVVTTAKLALQGLPQQTGPERAEVLRQTGGGEAR
jgi:hypothetical protein